jgi:hypothetical protein
MSALSFKADMGYCEPGVPLRRQHMAAAKFPSAASASDGYAREFYFDAT